MYRNARLIRRIATAPGTGLFEGIRTMAHINQFDAVTRISKGKGGKQSVITLPLPRLNNGHWYRTTELTNIYRGTDWALPEWRAIVQKYSYIANVEVA